MDEITLNEDQKLVLEKLKDFVESDKQHMLLMEGAAGTGKTTTVTKFIEWLLEETNISNIAMASPTHKALKVMMEMCPSKHKGSIAFSTLHSMLGLKHEINKDGKEIFVRDKNVMTKFPFFELVIIDESSMIADQLFNEMEDQNYRKIKVLFVGDSNQINPVNHKMSIPMLEEKEKNLILDTADLRRLLDKQKIIQLFRIHKKLLITRFLSLLVKKKWLVNQELLCFQKVKIKFFNNYYNTTLEVRNLTKMQTIVKLLHGEMLQLIFTTSLFVISSMGLKQERLY